MLLGTLVGRLEGSAAEGLSRVVWIVEDGTSVTATPLRPLEGGELRSELPAGAGSVRGARPENEEDLPLVWALQGTAEVPAGGVGELEPAD